MTRAFVERWLNRLWYRRTLPALFLWPLAFLYCQVVRIRIWLYQQGILPSEQCAVPVIVIGNLTVGGTGKTPLVLWLATFLRNSGFHPGIICSGYRRPGTTQAQTVYPAGDPNTAGDEAALLAQQSGCPVVACRNRVAAARQLLQENDCDIVLSDDGLQHYRLRRDLEIVLVDAERGLGNGFCLPAGPLREPLQRLNRVDMIVSKGESALADWHMNCACNMAYTPYQPDTLVPLSDFRQSTVHAVAGIANPETFFKCLRAAGLDILEKPYPDHHRFIADEINFRDNLPVLMTEKDAVKCRQFNVSNCWVVPLDVQIHDDFGKALLKKLSQY